MIKIKISDLLGKYKKTQLDLAKVSEIRPATISAYYHEEVKQIDPNHLSKFCKFFNCKIEDILEYVPDKEEI